MIFVQIGVVIFCGYVLWGSYKLLEAGHWLLLTIVWLGVFGWAAFAWL